MWPTTWEKPCLGTVDCSGRRAMREKTEYAGKGEVRLSLRPSCRPLGAIQNFTSRDR